MAQKRRRGWQKTGRRERRFKVGMLAKRDEQMSAEDRRLERESKAWARANGART